VTKQPDAEQYGTGQPGTEHHGLAHLWAGWRSAGFSSSASGMSAPAAPGCVFCRIIASPEPLEDKLVLHQDEAVMVLMNLYPYTSGHLMVVPTPHVGELAELGAETSASMWQMIGKADAVIRSTFHPDGTNIGINQGRAAGASIPDHLHVHIVPRWANDTNFMTAVADTRVMIETVHRSFERLSTNWK
jgi:ATP adenylyltransferase